MGRYVSAARLGETYLSPKPTGQPEWGTPEWPMRHPTPLQKAHPPAAVLAACGQFGHSPATFWCLFHGQWCVEWATRADQVDFGTCRCPGCIEAKMFYTGQPE